MSAAALRLGKFARSPCRSPAGPGTARPQAQTIKPKLQKIGPPNRQTLVLATASFAQRSPQSPPAHPSASPPALKSP